MPNFDVVQLAIDKATENVKLGNQQAATDILDQLSAQYPNDVRVINLAIWQLILTGQLDAAFDKIQSGLAEYPDDFDLILTLVNYYISAGDLYKAVEKLRYVENKLDHDPEKLIKIGNLQLSLSDIEGSRGIMKRLVDTDRFFEGFHALLCRYYIYQEDHQKAYQSLLIEVEHHTPSIAHLSQLLELCLLVGKKERAPDYIKQIELIGQNDVLALISLAYAHAFLGDYEKSNLVVQGLEMKNEFLNPVIINKLVNIYCMMGQYEKGLYIALNFLPESPNALPLQILAIELAIKLNVDHTNEMIEAALSAYQKIGQIPQQLHDLKFYFLMSQNRLDEAYHYRFKIFQKTNQSHEKILMPNTLLKGKMIVVVYSSGDLSYINFIHALHQAGAVIKIFSTNKVYSQICGLAKEFEQLDPTVSIEKTVEHADAWIIDFCLPYVVIPHVKSQKEMAKMSYIQQPSSMGKLVVMSAIINSKGTAVKNSFSDQNIDEIQSYMSAFNCINVIMYNDFPVQLNQQAHVLVTNQINLAFYAVHIGLQVFLFLSFDESLPFSGVGSQHIWFDNLVIIRQDLNIRWDESIEEFKLKSSTFFDCLNI